MTIAVLTSWSRSKLIYEVSLLNTVNQRPVSQTQLAWMEVDFRIDKELRSLLLSQVMSEKWLTIVTTSTLGTWSHGSPKGMLFIRKVNVNPNLILQQQGFEADNVELQDACLNKFRLNRMPKEKSSLEKCHQSLTWYQTKIVPVRKPQDCCRYNNRK